MCEQLVRVREQLPAARLRAPQVAAPFVDVGLVHEQALVRGEGLCAVGRNALKVPPPFVHRGLVGEQIGGAGEDLAAVRLAAWESMGGTGTRWRHDKRGRDGELKGREGGKKKLGWCCDRGCG